MTEEQRMEEGRRMFQIFAARMFEQRVLTAYREKVARERQDKLLEELDEEDQLRAQREEKKAKAKEKQKEKRRLQKLAKEEERLKREAEKAEEEAKQRAIEEKKAEEVRRRKEEQRMKREAEKKAMEEERRRKEEEKKKRLEDERERDKKRKEHQERERKKREELMKRAKEEKDARDKETREKREREDRERKERETRAKREAGERERIRKEEEVKAKAEAVAAAMAAATAAAKRPPVSIQTSMLPQPHGAYNSPHLSVATPAIPKQPVGHSPNRTRNASQQGSMQGSVASSPKTPQAVPRIGSSASPSTPILQQNIPGPIIAPNKLFQFPPHIPTSPLPHHIAPPPGVPLPDNSGFPMMNHMGMNGPSPMQPFLSGIPQRPFGNGLPMYQPAQMPMGSNAQYRGFTAPNGMPMQVPVVPGMRPMPPQGRSIFMGDLAPGMHQLPPGVPLMSPGSPFMVNRVEPVPIPAHSHVRALSGSFEPIPLPTPIQRPSSVAPPRDAEGGHSSVDELSKVMGSRALLEDDGEDLMPENRSPNRRGSSGIGFSPRPTRVLQAASPLFMDPMGRRFLFSFLFYCIPRIYRGKLTCECVVDKDIFPGPSWSNPAPLGNISNSLPSAWSTGAGMLNAPSS